ncbi:glycosyltransferase [Marinilabiliaceae bacterium JC017]|nr:glycosyltransferase [Marinilabiliaceae bacterium JC017]
MNILLSNSIGRHKWGGGEKWMILAAKGLMLKGHKVCIASYPRSIIESKANENQIPFVPIRISSDASLLGGIELHRFLKRNHMDVIIGCQNRDVRMAGIVSQQLKKETVILGRQGVKLINRTWKHKLTFKCFCDGIITNTKTIKGEYDNYGWWNKDFVKVIHNGVQVEEFNDKPFDFSPYLNGQTTNARIVLSAGRLSSQKGFEYLIDAASEVCRQQPDVYFFIAGKGKLEGKLNKRIQQKGLERNVFLIGFHKDLKPLFNATDLFVLPSLYEGMPNVVMEAMANDVPVVSTTVNGVEELLGSSENGKMIPPADVKALSKAIVECLNPDKGKALAVHAKKRILEGFTVDKMVNNVERFLKDKIEEKKGMITCKKFLVIQTAFIGDVILATPVIEKLARFYPGATIDVLVRKGNESLLSNNPHINRVLVFDKKAAKYRNLIRMIREVRQQKYDVVVNIQRYATTGLLTAFSKAKNKVGFDKNPLSRFFSIRIPHHMKESNEKIHEVDRNLQLIRHLTDDSFEMPRMYPFSGDYEKMKVDGAYYCIAPTSVWFTKQFPLERWIQLINRLAYSKPVFLLGGPGDRQLCEQVKKEALHPDVRNMAGELSFLESAALIEKAEMNFVNDSAPLHIASAVNAPVRAMFCSTVPAFGYTPLSDDSLVLETKKNLDCRPCGLHGKRECPLGHFHCADIAIDDILASFESEKKGETTRS